MIRQRRLARSRHRLADRPNRNPRRIIALGHHPLGEALEAVLHLGAGILLVGAVPGDRDQTLRADHRARVVVAVRHVLAEPLHGIDHPHHVVRGRPLGHLGHLRLNLLMARIGARIGGVEFIVALLDDLAAEAAGGALDRRVVVLIGWRDALQHEPSAAISSTRGIARARRPASPSSARCGRR